MGTGLLGVMGNKGAVAASIRVHSSHVWCAVAGRDVAVLGRRRHVREMEMASPATSGACAALHRKFCATRAARRTALCTAPCRSSPFALRG
eukprot:726100-Prymnesium_polylepis.1